MSKKECKQLIAIAILAAAFILGLEILSSNELYREAVHFVDVILRWALLMICFDYCRRLDKKHF